MITMYPVYDHRNLLIWNKAMNFLDEVYRITRKFPRDEMFGLTNQLRRAVVSIPSNIAEGHGRGSAKEFSYFLHVAKGSLAEAHTQILIAVRLHYVTPADVQNAMNLYDELIRMIGRLIARIKETGTFPYLAPIESEG